MERKTFFQSTPATTWTITHNAGTDGFDPVIDVYIETGGSYVKALSNTQRRVSANQTEVTFTEPQQGWATWIGGRKFAPLIVTVP